MLILLVERWLQRRAKTFHQILWGAAAILGLALLHTVLLVALYFPFSALSVTAFFRYRFFVLAIDLLTGIVVCGLVAGFAKARSYYLRLREEELKTAEMQAQIARAELEALKMQLHPHFLFNTLNAISALQSDEPEMAQLALARLADFLRLTLENAGIQEVILDRELDFVMRYLEIEKLRFGKRLTVRMEIDPTTRGARVPNLILQPLVENAIRHGIGAKAAPGRIEISSSKSNGALLLRVRDTGPGMAASPCEGIGLKNTRARLDRLYGSASCLRLENAAEGGVEASIEIPFMVDERG
jgi:LytS/YehU family sensor histidine kinase